MKAMKFEIDLPLFHGAFDLLLFFIEREELDIHDIPIAKITKDFLAYLKRLEELNVEVASEFIVVVATLMRIKSRMLLPRPVLDEEGNEIDPREELVQHLLEYKKYKSVVGQLALMEANRAKMEGRGNVADEIKYLSANSDVKAEMQDLDLYKMMRVFQRAMERFNLEKDKPAYRVVEYPYTVESQKAFVLERLAGSAESGFSFAGLVEEKPEKMFVIFSFLAILELLQSGEVTIIIGGGFNNFRVGRADSPSRVHH